MEFLDDDLREIRSFSLLSCSYCLGCQQIELDKHRKLATTMCKNTQFSIGMRIAGTCILLLLCGTPFAGVVIWSGRRFGWVGVAGAILIITILIGLGLWRLNHGQRNLYFDELLVRDQLERGTRLYLEHGEKRAENIEKAIDLFKLALETTGSTDPMEIDSGGLTKYFLFTAASHSIGEAYRFRIKGNRTENIENAIYHLKQALKGVDSIITPDNWVAVQNGLGEAYHYRIVGDRAENLETAIDHLQQALEVAQKNYLTDHATIVLSNLGVAYMDRIKGNQSENIEQTIKYLKQALEMTSVNSNAVLWGSLQNNLGLAYTNRILGERAENIENAIYHFDQALCVRARSDFPELWAQSETGLARAYSFRIQGNQAENFERTVGHFELALEIFKRSVYSLNWALTQRELGHVYHSRSLGQHPDSIAQAIYHFQQAQQVYSRLSFPVEWRQIQQILGDIQYNQKNWDEAYKYYKDAIDVGSEILTVAYTDTGRHSVVAETATVFLNAAYCLVRKTDYNEALLLLASGKTRLMVEELALRDVDAEMIPEKQGKDLKSLRNSIRELEAELRSPPDTPARRSERELVTLLEEHRSQLKQLVTDIRSNHPDFMPLNLNLDRLLMLIPERSALVAPLLTTQGSAIFVIPHGTKAITDEHIIRLDEYKVDQLNDISNVFLNTYIAFRMGSVLAQDFFNSLEMVTAKLWDAFVGKIHEFLSKFNVQNLILLPQGVLSLLPLHAAWREINGKREYLMDHHQVRYTPSLYALDTAMRRLPGQIGRQALVVGVSKYVKLPELLNTKLEAETIAQVFGTKALVDSDASVDSIKRLSPGKNYLHLSCHGSFNWSGRIFDSALYLANDEPLVLSEIIGKLELERTRLVTLSACETGVVDFEKAPDEFIGLPWGFMQAGASAVVSSSWIVEDRSTALLMNRMYKYIFDSDKPMEPAQALREAQLWLRNTSAKDIGEYYQSYLISRMNQVETGRAFLEIMMNSKPDDKPYSHLYYWAGMTYTGV